MKGKIYTVGQINLYVKRMMDRDAFLSDVFVRGEISNLKIHSSGHIYFTLKDKTAQINCVMFSSYAQGLKFLPETGTKVTVYGSITLYEKTGNYQLYARIMEPEGTGALHLAFEQLKNRLEKEGLFDPAKKKPLPEYPKTVAVLTSPTGAAIRDVITVTGRRNPNVEIVVVPVTVQGENAAASIAAALYDVNRWKGCDVIILCRGGGSMEDLWAFNEEIVARAIYASKIPVISAVGHETDFTIADFVADLRAATPSAAAEIAVKKAVDLNEWVNVNYKRLNSIMEQRLSSAKGLLTDCGAFFASDKFADRVYENEVYVTALLERLNRQMENRLLILKNGFDKSRALLNSLSPVNVLERGYVIAEDAGGKAIESVYGLKCGDSVLLRFKDGRAEALIGEIHGKKDI